jgi:hypothetical protein
MQSSEYLTRFDCLKYRLRHSELIRAYRVKAFKFILKMICVDPQTPQKRRTSGQMET